MTPIAEETLPNLLAAVASMIRMQHGQDCPHASVWESWAVLLEDAAVGRGNITEAAQVALGYLAAGQPAEVPA